MRELFQFKESHMSHFPFPISTSGSSPMCQGRQSYDSLNSQSHEGILLWLQAPLDPPPSTLEYVYLTETDSQSLRCILPFHSRELSENQLPTKGLYFPDTLQVRGGHDNTGFWTMKCDRKWCSAFTRPASQKLPCISLFHVFFPFHPLEGRCCLRQP